MARDYRLDVRVNEKTRAVLEYEAQRLGLPLNTVAWMVLNEWTQHRQDDTQNDIQTEAANSGGQRLIENNGGRGQTNVVRVTR